MFVRSTYPLVTDVMLINSCGSLTFDDHIVRSITPYRDAYVQTMREHRNNAVLLLEGGADIDPKLYGEQNTHSYPSFYRDAREIALYEEARELNIPIFGICRGHQLIAALNGGTLYQDIGRDLNVLHGSGRLVLDGIFAEWYPDGYHANSAHHQCVKRVPDNAVVVARDEKHPVIIEALAYPEDHMFSVQFHPEFMGDHTLLQHIVNWLFT